MTKEELSSLADKVLHHQDQLTPREKKLFYNHFKRYIEHVDEILIPTTPDHVLCIFKIQGFWSGVRYRIHLNADGGFSTTQRW